MALGLVQPWRNIGGRFNLGWQGFNEHMADCVDYAISKGRGCLFVVTYHFSRGDKHRGCAGFNYDTDAARDSAFRLRRQFNKVFGHGEAVHTVLFGIETDLDALVLHGDDEEQAPIDTADTPPAATEEDLLKILERLYPGMHERIRRDMLPLVVGNLAHIQEVRASNRTPVDILHREWVLAIGRGFDWLHEQNTAVILGPFDPQLDSAIETAGKLLLDNLVEGRIPKEHGAVLMSSAPHRQVGHDPLRAEEKALYYAGHAKEVIAKTVPDLVPYLKYLTTTMDTNTRALKVLDRSM
jgi:hypothetical protein